mmetsp:Transcript_66940/g.149367  ORF Transcript_66940/g.149367 Transcript_66940/m.149367 type:complete len:232 (-) Transcript_66940:142-837(-)
MDNFCQPDLEEPDLARFPSLSRVRGIETILNPGDVLWLPRYHWHLVQQLDPGRENISISFWLGEKGNGEFMQAAQASPAPPYNVGRPSASPEDATADDAADAAADDTADDAADDAVFEAFIDRGEAAALLAFRVGRLVETIAARTCGSVRRGGEFLTALTAGEDRDWDPSSKAVAVAARIRGQIHRLLDHPEFHPDALLRALTRHGRLYPGPPETDGDAISSDTVPGEVAR